MGSVAQVERSRVTVGVDTHKDTHTAAVKDSLGRTVGRTQVPTTPAGYRAVVTWAAGFGEVEQWGIEGTGSYGAGLARFLKADGHVVVEVSRPDRKTRRYKGKSDPVDAEAAARSVQAREATGVPKSGEGLVEAIRCLKIARSSAIKARTQAINELKALVVTAPAELREELRHQPVPQLVRTCCGLRPGAVIDVASGLKAALRSLARRCRDLDAEIGDLDADLSRIVPQAASALCDIHGVGTQVAAQLLITAGDNPERLSTEAGFAKLCGVAPLEASSGQVVRHRLNRGGDRQANAALYRVVVVRMGTDPRTRAYVAKRTAEGKSKREIMRCLKRFVAREVYAVLCPKPVTPATIAA
jgi:transposase